MTVTSVKKLRDIAQGSAADPRQALLNAVGDVKEFEPFHNLILVATYIQPEKTQGGVWLPDKSLMEDRFQGKVGLVLKVGPRAFHNDRVNDFGGINVQPGEWVVYAPSAGYEMFFVDQKTGQDGTPCRLLEDVHIKARINHPRMVY